ncbi:unnamed protein product [Dovyalis caffra]|uniref:Phytocyanin domain-containing protein n=1 Tax=Dovyalis caffra TaxID=77055 RepID=A0AAV1R9S9_9ROSI|nr:unnamed protein product [Dovyalis caffra]
MVSTALMGATSVALVAKTVQIHPERSLWVDLKIGRLVSITMIGVCKNGPFYYNDTLVFKYDPPSDTNTHPHSVYLLPDLWSFIKCDLSRAVLVANETQGGGDGFEFALNKWQPHYFACGGGKGS